MPPSDDPRCMIGDSRICSAMHQCSVCTPGTPEFDGRGNGKSYWPNAHGEVPTPKPSCFMSKHWGCRNPTVGSLVDADTGEAFDVCAEHLDVRLATECELEYVPFP